MNFAVLPHLRTSHDGALWVGLLGLMVVAVCLPALAQQVPNPAIYGKWEEPEPVDGDYSWPLMAVHAVHPPTDRVLVWEDGWGEKSDDPPRLWNPTDGSFTTVPNGVIFAEETFCSGHAALADGSILVAGGGYQNGVAHDNAIIFQLIGFGPWKDAASLNSARWYPTCTTLADGRVLATSGYDGPTPVSIPEIYDPDVGMLGEWNSLVGEAKELFYYPFMFVLPVENKVFYAGPVHTPAFSDNSPEDDAETYTLDIQTGLWTRMDNSPFVGACGSAVMYEPGKVLKSGGRDDDADCPSCSQACVSQETVKSTAMIDLSMGLTPVPQWDSQPEWNMQEARRNHNLVLLPTGQILAIGGANNFGFDPVPVLAAEWFDPNAAELSWRPLAVMTIPRAYHSAAVLLRDGRVLACGGETYFGNDEFGEPYPSSTSAEIFSPPYLFQSARPVIGYAPRGISYGQTFKMSVQVIGQQGAQIDKVTLLRLAAVTHSFDQNQRYMELQIVQQIGDVLTVAAPANWNLAPLGYYMLFVVYQGVPSVGEYVLLE